MYGELDTGITAVPPVMAALETAGVPHDFKVYTGANHAFFNDTGPRYDKAAATDAGRGPSRVPQYMPQVCRLTRTHIAALVGADSVGKTALALALADHCLWRWFRPIHGRSIADGHRHGQADAARASAGAAHVLGCGRSGRAYRWWCISAGAGGLARSRSGEAAASGRRAGLYVSAVCDGLAIPEVPRDAVFRLSLESAHELKASLRYRNDWRG